MPGGEFNGVQNKVVPAVYVDSKGEFIPTNNNIRGVTYFKYNMSWFDESTEDELAYVTLTRDEFYSPDSYSLLGVSSGDGSELAQLCEVVLRNSYRIVVDPLTGEGAAKATATVDGITITAKKNGTFGNTITVSSVQDTAINTLYNVKVYSDGQLVEGYNGISTVAQFNELSDFVEITADAMSAFAGITLAGGSDIVAIEADQAIVVEQMIDVMESYPIINSCFIGNITLSSTCAEFLQQRLESILENEGIRVIHNYLGGYTADSRRAFRIDSDGWIDGNGVEFDALDHLGFWAGCNAGLPPEESMTYMSVDGVRTLNKAKTSDVETKIRQGIGCLLQLWGNDGVPYVVIAKDINSLTTFTKDQPEFMSNGNVTRIEDDIVYNVQDIGQRIIIGKVRNTPPGRGILHAKISNYLTTLVERQVLLDFIPSSDLQVLPGKQPTGVLVKYRLKIASVIEYIYNQVTIVVEEAA